MAEKKEKKNPKDEVEEMVKDGKIIPSYIGVTVYGEQLPSEDQ